jgi:Tol biopolymer transport system component
MSQSLRGVLPILLLLLCATKVAGQALVPPDADWRTFDTQNFRVTFTPELEEIARRSAARAESSHALLSRELVRAPAGRIEMVVTNHVDFANGMATPFPSNRIIIYAHPPTNTTSLDFTNDWLELLILHELVHIFHLDHASGPLRSLRSVLGRNPLLFPQLWTTGWVVEGLAVYFESLLTGAGRVLGTHHDMVLRTAILQDEFFSIDRAAVDPRSWPGGATRYIYGSLFLDHLARTYGAETIPAFVESTGGMVIPYRLDAAARRTFGISFGRAWAEWEESLRTRYSALADTLARQGLTVPEVIVSGGRATLFPRYSPSGDALAYYAATGVDDPSTRLLLADGTTRVIERRFGDGPISWRRDGSGYLDSQFEVRGRMRIYTDLRMVERDGSARWLTRGARIWSADLHPDGRSAVAVADADGTNRLVVHDISSGETRDLVEPELDVHWAHPKWSPDGTLVAVARMQPGARFNVVILDAQGSLVREVTADRAVDGTPTWSPDGSFIVFSSDRTGISNLFAYELASERLLQVTNVITGAFQPDVSPDSRWIAFAHYQSDGYQIARVPFVPESWTDAPPIRAAAATSPIAVPSMDRSMSAERAPTRAYSAFPSVLPATWIPDFDNREVFGLGFGASAWGSDVVGRHDWQASGLLYPRSTRVEGLLQYWYRGFGNPHLGLDLDQTWRLNTQAGTELQSGAILPQAVLRRDRAAGASLLWFRPRFRQTLWGGLRTEIRERELVWEEPANAPYEIVFRQIPNEVGAAVNGGISTVRAFALSTGPQQGASLSTTISGHRYLRAFEGDDATRGYSRIIARSRAFNGMARRGQLRDVIALRLDGGAEIGSTSPGLEAGGTSTGSFGSFAGLTEARGFSFPVRGYPAATQWGDRVAVASAEYRVPLATVERGVGLLPVNLGRISAHAFTDAGSAWCSSRCATRFQVPDTSPDLLHSAGLEAVAELTLGFNFHLPLRGGVAVPLRGGDGAVFYLTSGRAF